LGGGPLCSLCTGRTIRRVSQPSDSQPSGGEVPGYGRHLAPAAILILVSGAFMAWAGYAFAEGRIAFGLWITTPPGFTIEGAFLLVRRHDRAAGHPTPTLRTRLGQETVILFAGGVMVLAGYTAAVWSWLVGAPLLLLGLPPIVVAVWLGRRGPAHDGAHGHAHVPSSKTVSQGRVVRRFSGTRTRPWSPGVGRS
jgi:hypothetical protein